MFDIVNDPKTINKKISIDFDNQKKGTTAEIFKINNSKTFMYVDLDTNHHIIEDMNLVIKF